MSHLQADAAQDGEAAEQPFLIWEDRGRAGPALAGGVPSEEDEEEEEEPAAPLSEVICPVRDPERLH